MQHVMHSQHLGKVPLKAWAINSSGEVSSVTGHAWLGFIVFKFSLYALFSYLYILLCLLYYIIFCSLCPVTPVLSVQNNK